MLQVGQEFGTNPQHQTKTKQLFVILSLDVKLVLFKATAGEQPGMPLMGKHAPTKKVDTIGYLAPVAHPQSI